MKKIIAVIASMVVACGLCIAGSVDGVTHALHYTNGFTYVTNGVRAIVTIPADALAIRMINTTGVSNVVVGVDTNVTYAGLYAYSTITSNGGTINLQGTDTIPQITIYGITAPVAWLTNRVDWIIFQK